jgi:hypothetical protein
VFKPRQFLGLAPAAASPILDARISEIRAELRVLGGKIDGKLDASSYKSDVQRFGAEINAKLAETEARLVRWVFLVMLGNVALSVAANRLINAFNAL